MSVLGYYPGCSLHGSASEYDQSLRAVAGKLEVELREIPDWVCCGATSAHAIDHEAALCLAADTLAKARQAGLAEVLAPCAMCYQRLATAACEMRRRPAIAAALDEEPGLENIKPVSVLGWLGNGASDKLKEKVTRPLTGLKVACYYGCLLVRPSKITGLREVEAPRQMEKLVTLLGGEPVRWAMAMECCGASFALSQKSTVLRQCRRIYDAAEEAGADVFCVACPMCHANLDMRQSELGIPAGARLPVIYLTQLAGWAMGLEAPTLGLDKHFVPAVQALGKLSKPEEKN
jgi:heterodisulfide reductase subunit B